MEDEADVVEAAGAGVAGEVALVIFSLAFSKRGADELAPPACRLT